MGLAVSTSLAQKGWKVTIADLNETEGEKAASSIEGDFVKTDVKAYKSLHLAFQKTFEKHGRINFVFANAGVGERKNFYTSDNDISKPPPDLDFLIDIDLKSVVTTAHLALHYFRKSAAGGTRCLILNASIASLYPVRFCPIYTAAKHGVVGFGKAISKHFYQNDGIRVNMLCPGNVRTNLLKEEEWDVFDMEWIELAQIVKIVELMLFDETMEGQIIEAAPRNHYMIPRMKYNDSNVEKTLEGPIVDSLGK